MFKGRKRGIKQQIYQNTITFRLFWFFYMSMWREGTSRGNLRAVTHSLQKVPDNSHASFYSKTFEHTIKQFVPTERIWFLLTKLYSHNSVFLHKPFRSTVQSCQSGAGEISRLIHDTLIFSSVLEWKTGSNVWNGILAYCFL